MPYLNNFYSFAFKKLIIYMKRTKYYVTPVLLLFCINLYGQYFKKLDMKDGLSNLSVLAIYQDTLGRMWFGTNEGVNIYDGERLSTYKSYEIIDNQLRKKKFINGVVDQIVGDFYGDVFLKTDGVSGWSCLQDVVCLSQFFV